MMKRIWQSGSLILILILVVVVVVSLHLIARKKALMPLILVNPTRTISVVPLSISYETHMCLAMFLLAYVGWQLRVITPWRKLVLLVAFCGSTPYIHVHVTLAAR